MAQPEAISTSDLSEKWNSVNKPGFGWVFYRFPDTLETNFTGGKVFASPNDKIAGPVFLIAPFYHRENLLWGIESSLNYQLADNNLPASYFNLPFYFSDSKTKGTATKVEYEKLVGDIISEIEKGNIKKAVPARAKHVKLTVGFSPFSLYKSLLAAYPKAFVYILSTPQTGTWIGCTPEKLLQVNNNEISTVSLAGTMKTNGPENPVFSPKEIHEQSIVTLYIQDIFRKYCKEIKMEGPQTISAGNLFHLATNIKGRLMPRFENEYLQILKSLHPTPAVCGMPLQASRNLLLQNENFDRLLYSGFLGPINGYKADIFVNLRCMQAFNNSALLYAGAGVVSGSIPENEWIETEEKMNTLLRFL